MNYLPLEALFDLTLKLGEQYSDVKVWVKSTCLVSAWNLGYGKCSMHVSYVYWALDSLTPNLSSGLCLLHCTGLELSNQQILQRDTDLSKDWSSD